MINVTKSYLPPIEEYTHYLEGIWERGWLTNNGVLVQELEQKVGEFLHVPFFQIVSNGMIALQIAIKALELKGEIITTPFSYVATTTSILWENCTPVFVDIEDKTFCIDAEKIESAITANTTAIIATHVYGYPCNVERIEDIARRNNLKVIYDGAHAFGCVYKGKSLLEYGDISTLSFHATKLFHTVEGGGVICHNKEMHDKLFLFKSFGHLGDDYYTMGINGKSSEFHAAMGLCTLDKVSSFIQRRKEISQFYDMLLKDTGIRRPQESEGLEYNYAYYPVIFNSEEILLKVKEALSKGGINTRRYFYPSLNNLPYLSGEACPVSESIAQRVLCLPLYYELEDYNVEKIAGLVKKELQS